MYVWIKASSTKSTEVLLKNLTFDPPGQNCLFNHAVFYVYRTRVLLEHGTIIPPLFDGQSVIYDEVIQVQHRGNEKGKSYGGSLHVRISCH